MLKLHLQREMPWMGEVYPGTHFFPFLTFTTPPIFSLSFLWVNFLLVWRVLLICDVEVLCLKNSGTCFQSMLVPATYAFHILHILISISSSSPIGAGNKMVPISKSSNTCMFSYCSFFLCLLLKIIHHFSCSSSILEFEALLIGVCFFI